MVALAIVSLGMIAVFEQISQAVAGASHLRNSTLAHWIATDRITAIRLKRQYPEVSEQSDEIEMANTVWRYTVKVSQTPAKNLRRIDVSVAFKDTPDRVLSTVTGFVTPPASNPPAGVATAWRPLDIDHPATVGPPN